MSPAQRVMDLIQRASWAGPLANSTYCEDERIDDMTQDNLVSFAKANFRTDTCSIASVGVPFEHTLKMAESSEMCRVSISFLCSF